jgi:fluoroacetyl-CoA thioesterase
VTIEVGITNEAVIDVTADLATSHAGPAVLSTPGMIGQIERICQAATAQRVPEGHTTVGVHVCVSHEAPVPVGGHVTISVRLAEIAKHRLTFETEVTDMASGRMVSRGTHQRAVVDTRRFGS